MRDSMKHGIGDSSRPGGNIQGFETQTRYMQPLAVSGKGGKTRERSDNFGKVARRRYPIPLCLSLTFTKLLQILHIIAIGAGGGTRTHTTF